MLHRKGQGKEAKLAYLVGGSYPCQLPDDLLERQMPELTDTIEAQLNVRPTSYRAGHRTCQAGAIAADAFDAERFNPPVGLGPRDQRLVAARVSDERLIA